MEAYRPLGDQEGFVVLWWEGVWVSDEVGEGTRGWEMGFSSSMGTYHLMPVRWWA